MNLALSVFLTTLVLEDVALVTTCALIANQQMDFRTGFLACAVGIAVGDLGLYALGRFSSKIPVFKRRMESIKFRKFQTHLLKSNRLDYAILVSRVIPGTRLPTYLVAGLAQYSLLKFTFLTVVSVGLWVLASLYFGRAFFDLFKGQWLIALGLSLLCFSLLRKALSTPKKLWFFKAALHSWRKWTQFEFWPSWFFYLPIVPYYIWLSLRYKSLWTPFYANPVLKHGGLIGESKWDFLKHLEGTARTTLPSCMISNQLMPSEILERIGRTGLKFPFVVKPDVGQRGFGVRIVHNEDDLFEYLTLSEGDVIAQQKSQYLKEAGVFYIRQPASKEGFLFSLTVKQFPFVVGDGVARLGDLILNDHRARIIANTYFQRHLESLDKTLARGEMFVLTECGNHCQGAVFVNGRSLMSDQLLKAVEHATSRIPDFYFGRIDVRYSSDELLHQGLDFEIIEVNGAGAEATHIWDTRTTLVEAYKVLFQQWRYLFSIGAVLRARGQFKQANSLDFLQDCYRVYFRKGPLTVSS